MAGLRVRSLRKLSVLPKETVVLKTESWYEDSETSIETTCQHHASHHAFEHRIVATLKKQMYKKRTPEGRYPTSDNFNVCRA